jgi:hypothetical protein
MFQNHALRFGQSCIYIYRLCSVDRLFNVYLQKYNAAIGILIFALHNRFLGSSVFLLHFLSCFVEFAVLSMHKFARL